MRTTIGNLLGRLLGREGPGDQVGEKKAGPAPAALMGRQWSGTSFIDSFKRERNPTPNELMAELKNTAFTCATINAGVCASFHPRLYVATSNTVQAQARCFTKPIEPGTEQESGTGTTQTARDDSRKTLRLDNEELWNVCPS